MKAQQAWEKPDSIGIDQTEIIGRYAANYAFFEKDDGTKRHNLALLLEKDFTKSIKAGLIVPLTYAETLDGDEETGVGDVKLNLGWRFYHTPKFSALLSGRGVLDTATEDILGDASYKLQTGLVGSWRKAAWLFSLAGGWTLSEDSDQNDVSISPLLGWQPMAKYLSYITLGPSFSYGLETEEDALGVTVFLGKVMKNKDVIALGSQYNLEGVDDNKAFLLLSWKRLF
jgi:hypothetical protein